MKPVVIVDTRTHEAKVALGENEAFALKRNKMLREDIRRTTQEFDRKIKLMEQNAKKDVNHLRRMEEKRHPPVEVVTTHRVVLRSVAAPGQRFSASIPLESSDSDSDSGRGPVAPRACQHSALGVERSSQQRRPRTQSLPPIKKDGLTTRPVSSRSTWSPVSRRRHHQPILGENTELARSMPCLSDQSSLISKKLPQTPLPTIQLSHPAKEGLPSSGGADHAMSLKSRQERGTRSPQTGRTSPDQTPSIAQSYSCPLENSRSHSPTNGSPTGGRRHKISSASPLADGIKYQASSPGRTRKVSQEASVALTYSHRQLPTQRRLKVKTNGGTSHSSSTSSLENHGQTDGFRSGSLPSSFSSDCISPSAVIPMTATEVVGPVGEVDLQAPLEEPLRWQTPTSGRFWQQYNGTSSSDDEEAGDIINAKKAAWVRTPKSYICEDDKIAFSNPSQLIFDTIILA